MTEINGDSIWTDIQAIRESGPLVHNITNYVVMNSTANALLAIGASPVMAHAVEEVHEMTGIASSLVINIGTLSPQWTKAMGMAMTRALKRKIPVVLDPVGAGATAYRGETVQMLLDTGATTLIRGNGSEIMALVDDSVLTHGVDSLAASESAISAAQHLAQRYKCIVCVSGQTDYIVGEGLVQANCNGDTLMARVTGMGCTASAICGAFLAVNDNPHQAVVNAMATMGIAGELAAAESKGPGTLQMHFLDILYTLDRDRLCATLKQV